MKILALTRYGRLGASSRLREYQYVPYLQSQGFDVTISPLFGDYYQQDLYNGRPRRWARMAREYLTRALTLALAPTYDLLWIEYDLFPWLPALAERLLSVVRIPYVVDYDDAIFERYERHQGRLARLLVRNKVDFIMRRARVVIVGNDYLGARAHAAGAREVEVLPTVVDLNKYVVSSPPAREPFTIGWMGSPANARYLALIRPALTEFCTSRSTRLIVVGARNVDLSGFPIELHSWSEDTEVTHIETFDVGIMPLPDEPWERGKSGYKLIQYMAGAKAVVASPVGVNTRIVDHSVNGFLANTQQDWRDALAALHESPGLRARMGQAGRRKVEEEYSLQVIAPRLARVLRNAISDKPVSS
jgi:glycosyltransferase involved in cell wall biosynthesis